MKTTLVFVLVSACLVLMYLYPHQMLNPGELVEGHQELNAECLSCHQPFQGISNEKCVSCHKLADIGEDKTGLNKSTTAGKKVLFHQHLEGLQCTSCHSDHAGMKPGVSISRFSHEMLSEVTIANCNRCHVQPGDKLHQQLTTECKSCHDVKSWRTPGTFAHAQILADSRSNCTSCHSSPDDAFHRQVKDNCDKCHSNVRWKPSTFDHSGYFELDRNHDVQCKTCHFNNNFSVFTCYGCHEHSENKIREEHWEHGISDFTNCTSCHKNANEHEVKMNGGSDDKMNQDKLNKVKNYLESQEKKSKKESREEREQEE